MNSRIVFKSFLCGIVLLGHSLAQSSQAVSDFTPCQISGLTVVKTDRLPKRPTRRTFTTSKGERTVTMVDGYRILYLLDPDELMLNMKMERLEIASYPQQKADLIDLMTYYSKDPPMSPDVLKRSTKAVQAYTSTRKDLSGGVLSISEIFHDATHSVMTIYYLNDEPDKRQFKNMEQFVKLRDKALSEAVECMERW